MQTTADNAESAEISQKLTNIGTCISLGAIICVMVDSKTHKAGFRRSPGKPVEITARDLQVLYLLARYRFLDSDQIVALVREGSAQHLKRRLQDLFHAGFVDRPRAQIRYFATDGRKPFVYALARLGAKALMDYGKVDKIRLDWANKNKTVQEPAIKHTLSIADALIPFEMQKHEAFISEAELLGVGTMRKPLRWKVQLAAAQGGQEIGVVPDSYFALRDRAGKSRYFFLEADRGKMPIVRTGPRQTSLLEKVFAYTASYSKKLPQEQFGIHAFRVVLMVPSEERRQNFINAVREALGDKAGWMFLVGTYDGLKAADPFDYEFLDARGATVKLGQEA